MGADLWVARLYVSARTAEKIVSRHQLTPDEVRDAVQCRLGLDYVWQDLEDGRRKAIVRCTIRGMRVMVVMYPADDPLGDCYNLASAYEIRA